MSPWDTISWWRKPRRITVWKSIDGVEYEVCDWGWPVESKVRVHPIRYAPKVWRPPRMNHYFGKTIKAIRTAQTLIKTERLKPHHPCPCGSKKRFSKCCALRVARGEGLKA